MLACLVVLALPAAQPGHADERERMDRAVDWLIANQQPSGLFPYDFNFLAGTGSDTDRIPVVNLARQVLTVLGLADYYLHTGDARARGTIETALPALGRLSLPAGKGTLQSLVEWTRVLSLPAGRWRVERALKRFGLLYDPEGAGKLISPDGDYKKALAGPTAMALLAELRYFRASGDDRFAGLRKAWLEGLMALHVPGRGFRREATRLRESPYGNAEGWLALAEYNATFPGDEAVADMLADVDDYMMERYTLAPVLPFYHWGTMAAGVRLAATGDGRFRDFMANLARWFLDDEAPKLPPGFNTCYMVEGLATAVGALGDSGGTDDALLKRIHERLAIEVTKIRALQIAPGLTRLEFEGGAVVEAPGLASHAGTFLAGTHQPETQIDTMAHCIMAMVRLERYAIEVPE